MTDERIAELGLLHRIEDHLDTIVNTVRQGDGVDIWVWAEQILAEVKQLGYTRIPGPSRESKTDTSKFEEKIKKKLSKLLEKAYCPLCINYRDCGGECGDIATRILSLIHSFFEPVELEALECRPEEQHCNEFDCGLGCDYGSAFEEGSQATIQPYQKGQLFRLKEG